MPVMTFDLEVRDIWTAVARSAFTLNLAAVSGDVVVFSQNFSMRCHFKTAAQVVVGLLILTSLYISIRRGPLTGHKKSKWWSQNRGRPQNSSTGQCSDDAMCLRSKAVLLAGTPSREHKYLAVGLSSVKRKKENYLFITLKSIFDQSSEAELSEMVVVVFLADFDLDWVEQTLVSLKKQFSTRLEQGQLLIICADSEAYPPLTGLKRNFNDAPDRVTFRSKQNVDYAFLVDFSAYLSSYYLMLEDDVTCSKGFLSSIRSHVNSRGSSPWVTLEFSKLGYIGKLYHSEDLPRLAQFFYLFYQEMPCDFLLSHFRTLLMQDKVIRFQPSLFQHIGTYSSFMGNFNKLKDEDFTQEISHNPPADVYTDIAVFENHSPEKAYMQGLQYFWGKSPITVGNYLIVAFQDPTVLTRVLIQTGVNGKDTLESADVELGETVVKMGSGVECSETHRLGSLQKGVLNHQNVQQTVNRPVVCLRIRVTASQENWVIIRNIQVWTAEKEKAE